MVARLDELWPPCGPCAFCGGPDKRHRLWDMIKGRHAEGETVEALAEDYGVTTEHIDILVRRAGQTSIVCPDCSPVPGGHVTMPVVVREGVATCWRCGWPGRAVELPPGAKVEPDDG